MTDFIINNWIWLYGICFIITFVLVRLDWFAYDPFRLEYKRTWSNLFTRTVFSFAFCLVIAPSFLIVTPIGLLIMGLIKLVEIIPNKYKMDLSKPPKFL